MSDQAISYPTDAGSATYLLTVRGEVTAPSIADVRELHNATAGAPEGVAAARALGDLSHNVYGVSGSTNGEILFIDHWNSLSGLGQFFSDPQVQAGASQLFAERDGVVWAPTNGFGNFHLAAPSGSSAVAVGLLRAGVTSLEAAAKAFDAYASRTINTARRYGLLSHTVTIDRLGPQFERPQIGGLEDRRGYDRVEASVAKIAPERSAGPLEHAHFDAGPLAGEPMQEQRCVLPAGEAREPHAKRAADPRANVGAGLTCSLGGGQRDARPLEEQLARSRQVNAASVPVEQLNAELCL